MAKDIFHDLVKTALVKAGWTITHDPLELTVDEVITRIDLGAERLIAAELNGEKIAVEVKSFAGLSAVNDFHTALGQFLNYRLMLELNEPERQLYLAIPLDTYNSFFQTRFAQLTVQRYALKLIVYHVLREEIVQWIN